MTVLVSGGTGLVGRYIVEGLLAAGYRVAVGGRRAPAPGLFPETVRHVPLTLDATLDQSRAFKGIDHFVHAAFDHLPGRYRGGEGDDPEGFRARNLDGTVRLFEEARSAGVRRCVFLSSRAVYDGLTPGTLLDEDQALQPTSLYGEVKLRAERALAALCRPGFAGVSLRSTGVYGDLRPNKWDGLFADFLADRPVPPRAGSEVHGRDVGSAVRLLLEAEVDRISARSFNASDIVTDHREILSIVKEVTGTPGALPPPADRGAVAQMRCDRLRALGWQPGGRALLQDTVRRLAARL